MIINTITPEHFWIGIRVGGKQGRGRANGLPHFFCFLAREGNIKFFMDTLVSCSLPLVSALSLVCRPLINLHFQRAANAKAKASPFTSFLFPNFSIHIPLFPKYSSPFSAHSPPPLSLSLPAALSLSLSHCLSPYVMDY